MTLNELLEKVAALRPNDNVAVSAEAWHYDDGRTRLVWDIWSSRLNEHFYGHTPEAVLAALEAALADRDHDATERIKEVVV